MQSVFHLAYHVTDLDEARAFYGGTLGCAEGRSTDTWVDFDFFGQDGHYITERAYDLLFHARINLCEAGSLIRRRVFDAGVRFDETMKRGYEDWDFWLSAAQKGFRGQAAAQPLLLYRKRPVSMLSNSHDLDAELRRHLEQKHDWLFNTPKLLALEAARFPRFAVIEGEGAVYIDASGARAADDAADVTLTASRETFEGLLSGDVNPTMAFMTGKLKVDGSMPTAMKLGALLG